MPLNFVKSIGTFFILSTFNSSTFAFKLSKLVVILTSSFMSSLSTSTFKAIKSLLAAYRDASIPVGCSNSF